MKKIFCLIFIYLLLSIQETNSQTSEQGYIKYQLVSASGLKKDNREIGMYFTSSSFFYTYLNKPDFELQVQNLNDQSDKKEEEAKKEAFKKAVKQLPEQTWYANSNSDIVTYTVFDASQKQYCIKDTLQLIKWTILEDTMTLKSLKCFKATGLYMGYDYTAWYYPTIPTTAAPLYFRGLPGLLINVKNNKTGAELNMMDLQWPLSSDKMVTSKIPCLPEQQISKQAFSLILYKQNSRALTIMEELKEMKEKEKKGIKTDKKVIELKNGNL